MVRQNCGGARVFGRCYRKVFFSLSLVYDWPGSFGEQEFTARKYFELSNKSWLSKARCVSSTCADWLIVICYSNFGDKLIIDPRLIEGDTHSSNIYIYILFFFYKYDNGDWTDGIYSYRADPVPSSLHSHSKPFWTWRTDITTGQQIIHTGFCTRWPSKTHKW